MAATPEVRPSRLLVVGSPSVDLLHFRGQSRRSAGGAGLYTGLAAQRAGADVMLLAPRPAVIPEELREADQRLEWVGPPIGPSSLPHFEIEYTPDGETVYHRAVRGSEGMLTPEHLPAEGFDLAYVVPLIDPRRQLKFARHVAERGIPVACGAYRGGARGYREVVREVVSSSDFFFCNQLEAELLFGSLEEVEAEPGRVIYVTRGARGARVFQGTHWTDVPAPEVEELDPTGAGDTFCGTVLAGLLAGGHPVAAAWTGVEAAARTVTGVGPARLLDPDPPDSPSHRHGVEVVPRRVARMARVLASAPEARRFDFVGDAYPGVGDPHTLDFFFAATAQQFGFWHMDRDRYVEPVRAPLDGVLHKGSDFLWAAFRRWLDEAPEQLTPAGQARLTRGELDVGLRDDSGRCPLPTLDLALGVARAYGRDMESLRWTPALLIDRVADAARPQQSLLQALDHVGGYKEDPLRKKSALLAAILEQRPERFIQPAAGEALPAIVDYHALRSVLRMGLVEVTDELLRRRLAERSVVTASEEQALRRGAARAIEALRDLSGRPMGAVDWFLFQNRSRCPEMSEPVCDRCPADPACAHRTELFQPVFRTTAY